MGCVCECTDLALCFATDLACPTGAESDLAGHVVVLTPDDEILGPHAREELTGVCAAEGTACGERGG